MKCPKIYREYSRQPYPTQHRMVVRGVYLPGWTDHTGSLPWGVQVSMMTPQDPVWRTKFLVHFTSHDFAQWLRREGWEPVASADVLDPSESLLDRLRSDAEKVLAKLDSACSRYELADTMDGVR